MPPKRKETREKNSASKRQSKQHQNTGNDKNSSSSSSRDGEDIISSLSDSILHHILSFLDMKHAVQSSVLSKRWRDLWTSLRSLTFDTELFYSPTRKRFDGFQNFVDQVLILRDKSYIDVFHLMNIFQDCEIKNRLSTWLVSIIRSKVGELYLDVLGDGIQLPSSLFTCNSLTRLMLSMRGSRRWSITLPDSMGLPNLVVLQLCSVSFNDEKLTNKFFLSCPNVEALFLDDVEFLRINLNISCLKLNDLNVKNHGQDHGYCRWPDSKFKLYAPNLKKLSFKDFMSKDYILKDLTSLIRADIDMKLEEEDQNPGLYSKLPAERKLMYAQRLIQILRALLYVEDLKLTAWFLEVVSGSSDLLGSEPSQLFDLTCLRLETWLSSDIVCAITYLLSISPNLESLFLKITKVNFGSSNIGENPKAEVSLQCLLDKLELVEIEGAVGCANELKFLEILLKNANVLKKLFVYTCKEDSLDREKCMMKFNEKLLTFPRASSNVTILFI